MTSELDWRVKYTSEFVRQTIDTYQKLVDFARRHPTTKYADLAIIIAAREFNLHPGHEEIEVLAGILMEGQE